MSALGTSVTGPFGREDGRAMVILQNYDRTPQSIMNRNDFPHNQPWGVIERVSGAARNYQEGVLVPDSNRLGEAENLLRHEMA